MMEGYVKHGNFWIPKKDSEAIQRNKEYGGEYWIPPDKTGDVNICILHKEEWVPLNCVVQDIPDMREEMPIQLHTDGMIVQSYYGWMRVSKNAVKFVHKINSTINLPYKAQNWIRRCKKMKWAQGRTLIFYEQHGVIERGVFDRLNRLPYNRT